MVATKVVRDRLYGTGKYHLASDERRVALCGVTPSCPGPFKVSGERAAFEAVCPARICKLCRRAEQD